VAQALERAKRKRLPTVQPLVVGPRRPRRIRNPWEVL
jgi:hypothetical protein